MEEMNREQSVKQQLTVHTSYEIWWFTNWTMSPFGITDLQWLSKFFFLIPVLAMVFKASPR